MKALFSEIRGAVLATVILAVVCCGLYPLVVFGISQVAFHQKANGSLIVDKDGTIHGSKLLGQGFTAEKYFHPSWSSVWLFAPFAPISLSFIPVCFTAATISSA